MPLRFADMDPTVNGVNDFAPRQRKPTITQILLIFVALACLVAIICFGFDDKNLQALTTSVLLIASAWYIIDQTQRNRDLVLATEFQNALFSSALGLYNKFCLIIRRDGNIVYLDRAFQDMFPNFTRQSHRTLDMLLELGAVSRADVQKIFGTIDRGTFDKVVFKIRDNKNDWHNIVLSVEPIIRPSGFILLRGREFVENRTTSDTLSSDDLPKTLNRSTITLFSYVMDTMNMGVYMTGTEGKIIYVNPVLERWLEYKDGEIIDRNLSLQDLVVDGGARTDTINPTDFEGDVILLKKTGGHMRSFVNQKIIFDDNKRAIGCTALVHNFIEDVPSAKRKLW